MTGAILWVFVAGGFWGEHKSHHEGYAYYDLWTCNAGLPFVVQKTVADGYVVTRAKCVEVRDRG